ncbi:MAG: hypothetical protein H7Y33_10480 [Cytophagales bacterium]|nr:hypothetical protein [Rhizobacter sp.]
MSKPITPPSCPAKPTTPRELLSRAYPQLGTTLFMGTQIAPIRMTRHDLVVLLSMHPGQAFGIEAAGFSADVQAAVVAPNAPHTIHAKGCEIVHLAIQLFHPRFGALRSLLSQAVTPLAREKFAPLDSQLLDASDGRLDADEATQLVKDIGTVLLQAGTPSSRALDPRVVYALRKLAADIDYPFAKLAAELHVSRSACRTSSLNNWVFPCAAARLGFAWAWPGSWWCGSASCRSPR